MDIVFFGSPRYLRFVGITVQKSGRLVFMSTPTNESDQWTVEVRKDHGPIYREGVVTIQSGGYVKARSLAIKAVSLVVDSDGLLTLDGQGHVNGKYNFIIRLSHKEKAKLY